MPAKSLGRTGLVAGRAARQNQSMEKPHRWKRLLVVGAAVTCLATILWAAYLFTAIWLRVKCARELAAEAQEIPVIAVADDQDLNSSDAMLEAPATNGVVWIDAFPDLFADLSGLASAVDRLEELQRPSVRIVWKHLVGRRPREQSPLMLNDISFTIDSSPIFVNASTTPVEIAALEATEALSDDRGAETKKSPPVATNDKRTEARVTDAVSETPAEAQTDLSEIVVTLSQQTVQAGQQLAIVVDGWWPTSRAGPVVDSDGVRMFLVGRTRRTPSEHSDSDATPSSATRELLLVDPSGRIMDRREMADEWLLGKLSQPLGKADQLVFGPRQGRLVRLSNGRVLPARPSRGTVYVVENGSLKKLRPIELRGRPTPEESFGESRPDASPAPVENTTEPDKK